MKLLVITLSVLSIVGCSSFSKKNTFKLREHSIQKLSNGLKVYLIKDDGLPYLSLQMLIHSGTSKDPIGKEGVAHMAAEMLSKGSQNRSAIQIAEDLEQKGTSFSVSVSSDYTKINIHSLSEHYKESLKDFIELVTLPVYKNSEIRRYKKQMTAALLKTVDVPSQFANVAFYEYLYGNHPYGKRELGTPKSIRAIKRADIIKYYLKNYRPNNATLAIVGNYPANIIAILEKNLSHWEPREVKANSFPVLLTNDKLKIRFIDKKDLKQSQIRIGQIGIKRKNKDYLALRLGANVLGGAFSSRLMNEIRVKRGLTYGISSRFSPLEDRGPFTVSTFSRHDKLGEAVKVTMGLVREFQAKGITSEELKEAKALMRGRFPRAIETAEQLAFNLLILDHYKVNKSYLSNLLDNIDDLSLSQVNKAIKKYISPGKFKILIYSSKEKTMDQIKDMGEIEIKNYKEFL